MKKRILSMLLAIVMVVGLMPAYALTVFAAEGDVAKIGETEYSTLYEAVKAATAGQTITLLCDADLAFTDNPMYNNVNASVIDLNGKTLTIKEGDIRFGNTTIKNGNIVVDAAVNGNTGNGIFYMFGDNVLTLDGVKLTADNINIYSIFSMENNSDLILQNGTEVIVNNCTLYGVIAAVSDGENIIDNSKITVTNLAGRGFLNGNYTVKGTSEITMTGVTKDGFYIGEGDTLNIQDTAKVNITLSADRDDRYGINLNDGNGGATYTKATTAMVDATDNAPAYVAYIGEQGYESIAAAVFAADSGDTITLLTDVTLGEKLTISGNVKISGAHTITRADAYTGTLFEVDAGATLTLDGGLVIDGNNNYDFNEDLYNKDLEAMESIPKTDAEKYFTPEDGKPVAAAYMIVLTKGTSADAFGGTVNLNNVTIQNNYSVKSGIVNAAQYTSTVLNGAKITHVAATQVGGVVVRASGAGINVEMNNGTVIDGNHVGSNHGIFYIYSGAVFTMNGGEVKNTTGWDSNGSVVGLYGGTFIMNGGTICSNSAVYGPANGRNAAIYLHSNSVMEMNGGTICHNTGRSRGGIDSSKTTSTLTITGGSVLDNISLVGNSDADVGGTVGTWKITGGTFTQDVSAWLAEGNKAVQLPTGVYIVIPATEFVVTFDPNDGSCDVAYAITTGRKLTELPTATRDGYIFDGWYLADGITKLTISTELTADVTVTAAWIKEIPSDDDDDDDNSGFDYDAWYWAIMMLYNQQFDVSASATEGGAITPAGISKVKYDKNITYTITPDEGYAIADVLVNGESVGAVSEYTIKRIKKDQTIHAIFVKTAWENPYTDVSDEAWYYEDIEFVSENGLMIGTGDNKFSPNAVVNRAMLVTVLWRLEGSPVVDSPVDFSDVPADEWYTAAVNWAAANGIVNGYGDGIFGAMNDLTHEQIMAILNRYAVYKKWSENVSGNADDSYTNSEWAENNVLWADLYGMFDGIGSDISDLTEGADRAELAAYLRRFFERFMAE